jgi:hypothetical protein
MINIEMLTAEAFMTAPMKKLIEPTTILAFLRLFFVRKEAPNVDTKAAK